MLLTVSYREYMQRLCEEIDDLIEVTGQASLADLSRNFSLPINFLAKVSPILSCCDVFLMYTFYGQVSF